MDIVVAGLGLIGGSFAKAAALRGHRVWGFDKNPEVLRRATAECVIMGEADSDRFAQSDLIFAALPPSAVPAFLREHAERFGPRPLVLDACGVKTEIVRVGEELAARHGFRFLGGHPMAGREVSGYSGSLPNLFEGASFILTPGETDTEPHWLEPFLKSLGFATIRRTTPAVHDRMIAYTSQLPHVLACAYIRDERSASHTGFSAGSFRDMIRVAGVDEHLWTELFSANRAELAEAVAALCRNLTEIEDALRADDKARIRAILADAKRRKRKTLPDFQNGKKESSH